MDMYIGGIQRQASNGRTLEVWDPAHNCVIDTVPVATKEDIDLTIETALTGAKIWGNCPIYERTAIMEKFVSLVMQEDNRHRLSEILSKEMGKPITEAYGDFASLKAHIDGFISAAKNVLTGGTLPIGSERGKEKDLDVTIREPIGAIVCIIPFNAPLVLFSKKVAPALLTGNSVIIKPASEDPLTVIELTKLLLEAGVPGEACNVVTGSGADIGDWLTADPRIAGVTFTGSTEVGQVIAANAARNMKYISMELGGNAPLIICEDADIEYAVKESLPRANYLTGQICSVSKRYIVHRSIKDAYVKRLVEELAKIKIGDPSDPSTQMGTLISEKAAKKVEEQVNLTVSQGAVLVMGGKRDGAYFGPTVLDGVTDAMDIAHDMEVFGPVFPIITFDDVDEAIEIANATKYGLGSGIITKNMEVGLKAARKIQAGTVVINGHSMYRNLQVSWGGYKMSGGSRDGQTQTLLNMTQTKNVIFKNLLPAEV